MLSVITSALAGLYLLLGVLWLARRKEGYRHSHHSISELGEKGATDERLVAWGLFFPVGLLIAGTGYLLLPVSRPAAGLAAAIAVGYVGAAIFPCDQGAPAWGSWRNLFHFICGGIQYLWGGTALMLLGETLGRPFEHAGMVVLLSALAIGFLPIGWYRGAVQRVAETLLFGSLVAAAWMSVA